MDDRPVERSIFHLDLGSKQAGSIIKFNMRRYALAHFLSCLFTFLLNQFRDFFRKYADFQ